MTYNYKALNFSNLNADTSILRAFHLSAKSASRNDPAIVVMTDLKRVTAFSIRAAESIFDANEKMISCGVRLLFVVDDQDTFIGLITAADLLGEKPVKYMQEHGGAYKDILVMDVMTRRDHLDAVDINDVARAQVGNIVETLLEAGRQHVLVYEDSDSGKRMIRGLFSSTQISRQLDEEINLTRASSFAALEMALVSAV